MNLQPGKGKYSLSLILLVLFLVLIIGEVYLGYTYIYSSLFAAPQEVVEQNVVRVRLQDYQEAIQFIESQYDYTPEPIVLPRPDPFK